MYTAYPLYAIEYSEFLIHFSRVSSGYISKPFPILWVSKQNSRKFQGLHHLIMPGMVLKSVRHALSLCFVLLVSGFFVMGRSRKDGAERAIKTVKTEYGDIYDCVDFYKQPAFDHPLLKNHTFHPEMMPTTQPQRTQSNIFSRKTNATAANISPFKDGGCPRGTVPIRRTNKSKVLSQQSSKAMDLNTENNYVSGDIIAISQTKSNPWKTYHGVGAFITVYNPRVVESQYSSGEIIIRSGADRIIVGWTVNPHKYGDKQTRLFAYVTTREMRCFNNQCGFVSVRPDFPLDLVLHPVSTSGGTLYEETFLIHRDQATGNWWLKVGGKDPQVTVGFWPQKIFTGLQGPATYAACGGEAYTPPTLPPPQMGAGYLPWLENLDAYCTDFTVVDEKYNIVDVAESETYANHDRYYRADDRHIGNRHVVVFGGPNPH